MKMKDDPENPEFQRKFTVFYRGRRNDEWRKKYFQLMTDFEEKKDPIFGEVLLRIYQATGQIEPSFGSKMLATINNNMPIWDSHILKALNFKLKGKTPELKMSNAVVLYDQICCWYNNFLQNETAAEWIETFDKTFTDFTKISSTKKKNFILWAGY